MNIQGYVKLSLVIGFIFMIGGCVPRVRSNRVRANATSQQYNLPIKGIKQTNREEALLCKDYYKQKGDLELTAKYLEHALTLVQDHTQRGELLLELADCYMSLEEREKAARLYGQYKVLYPGSASINYVLFQELLAQNYEILTSTKDQSKTKETLKLAQEFLQEFPDDTAHRSQVEAIIQKCYFTLIASEMDAASFYISKYRYTTDLHVLEAAYSRIKFAINEYLPHVQGMERYLKIDNEIDKTSPETFYKSLEHVVNKVKEHVQAHVVQESTLFSRFFGKKDSGTVSSEAA